MSQNVARCVTTRPASVPSAAAAATSETIINRRRSNRSAATPATRLNASIGVKSTAPT
jgi:hypothetical protein